MGSPLGPTISNFCLAHLENELLSVSKFKPELYLRYVDDIFCVFRDQSTYEKFFQQLNELHSSLNVVKLFFDLMGFKLRTSGSAVQNYT